MFQFLDGAHDVQRIAEAVVGIDHQCQIRCASDAPHFGGEFRGGEHDDVGGADGHGRGDRSGQHADRGAGGFGQSRGQGVIDAGGRDAALALQGGAQGVGRFVGVGG